MVPLHKQGDINFPSSTSSGPEKHIRHILSPELSPAVPAVDPVDSTFSVSTAPFIDVRAEFFKVSFSTKRGSIALENPVFSLELEELPIGF